MLVLYFWFSKCFVLRFYLGRQRCVIGLYRYIVYREAHNYARAHTYFTLNIKSTIVHTDDFITYRKAYSASADREV